MQDGLRLLVGFASMVGMFILYCIYVRLKYGTPHRVSDYRFMRRKIGEAALVIMLTATVVCALSLVAYGIGATVDTFLL